MWGRASMLWSRLRLRQANRSLKFLMARWREKQKRHITSFLYLLYTHPQTARRACFGWLVFPEQRPIHLFFDDSGGPGSGSSDFWGLCQLLVYSLPLEPFAAYQVPFGEILWRGCSVERFSASFIPLTALEQRVFWGSNGKREEHCRLLDMSCPEEEVR